MSQTPVSDETKIDIEYQNGWASTRKLIVEEGASLSGRERNFTYLNLGDGSFADVSEISGANVAADGRALAVLDWDDDGREDLLLRNRTAPRLQLFRNAVPGGHFLALELEAVGGHPDAVGAVVTVEAGGRRQRRALVIGDGFLAQSSKRLHFGLGSAESAASVSVRWPQGVEQVFDDLPADRRYLLREGVEEPIPIAAREPVRLEVSPVEADPRRVVRLPLLERLPLEPLTLPAFSDRERTIGDLAGSPVLVNLWSLTCAACRGELSEFRARRGELEEAGLRLVTLSVDEPDQRDRARALMEELGFEADAGQADTAMLEVLELLFATVVGAQEETPLPASLLLDARGRLSVLYLGVVEFDELIEDVRLLGRQDGEQLDNARLLFGSPLVERSRGFAPWIKGLRSLGRDDWVAFYRELAASRRGEKE